LIDPVTIGVAYKAATSAIDLIKKGINMHKDATEIGDHLLQYFEKRDEAQRLKKELQKQNKIELLTKYSIKDVKGNGNLESVEIKHDDGNNKEIKADYVLGFFGLIMQLGPILDWGLNIDKKTIPVNTENFETNKKGIFAIGDICTYPGKLKLILSGFHEGALAARGCFKYARPDEKYRFEFTTASNTIKDRLGLKE
jgi:thioredoxin reductase (NADPH)